MSILTGSIIVAIIGVIVFGRVFLNFLLDYKEHVALGYKSVYLRELALQIIPTYVTGILFLLLSWLSVIPFRKQVSRALYTLIVIPVLVVGWLIGYGLGHIDPTTWLLFFHHQSFNRVDPIFHLDMSFYVYTLPVLKSILAKLIAAMFYFIILRTGVIFIISIQSRPTFDDYVRGLRYVSRISAVIFLLFAVDTFLGRYSLLYTSGEGNFLFGPNFTQTHLTLPVTIWVKTLTLVLVSIAFLLLSFKGKERLRLNDLRTYKPILWSFVSFVASSIILALVALAMNRLYVHPNQQTVEAPYIKRSIDATRWAANINKVQTKPFISNTQMDNTLIDKNKDLLKNVRINDIGQTQEIYDQLQSFKSYFTFKSANADRYNGKEVYIAVRQLDQSKLPVQTWINKKLVYTHGYGVAASPVNEFDSKGLPITVAMDTPQKTKAPIPKITQPNIYFGSMSNEVVAPSKQGEFDYPLKSADHTSHYQGGYNLPLKGNRLLLAIEKGSLKYITSSQFTDKSQLIFDRNIYTRVKDIAPFISYDSDAYPFITDNGHVKWILDAYTKSSRIPYAQNFHGTSYIRNSMKVVIDAYTGKVTFYVIDKKDPMIQSLMQVYPELFTTKIPKDVTKHFRYPRDLFQLQSKAITTYHMTSPAAFYNQEDLWDIAKEVYQQNNTQERPPVYQMIQMPGEANPEFVLSELFTPNNKMNLNGWLIANNEPNHYGELTLYQFPQSSLFFGPMQAENQIDSNTDVSGKLTLWNQNGSHVIRGNLLLVPIGKTALYIEPIYLVADRKGALPQLQRVVIDFNEKVYMGTTLTDALRIMINDITGGAPSNPSNPPGKTNQQPSQGASQSVKQLAKQANQLLDQYKKDTANGDYAKAGQDMEKLQNLLQKILASKK